MANALKGKTLTTLTVILPNEEVAAEWADTVSGHLEFMQEKLSGWSAKTNSVLCIFWP